MLHSDISPNHLPIGPGNFSLVNIVPTKEPMKGRQLSELRRTIGHTIHASPSEKKSTLERSVSVKLQ